MRAGKVEELLENILDENSEIKKIHICVDNEDGSTIDIFKGQNKK